MATQATQISHEPAPRGTSQIWFRGFIRWEVAPYPGRINAVIRMTITATLVMLIVETFRIPNAFLAGLYSILLARENLAATWRNGRIVVVAFVGASLYTLLGMILFRGYPIAHFFWVAGSLYLVFFVMRTTTNYAAALVFAIPIGIALPLWDRSLPSEVQVESTLWPIVIIAVGAGVTLTTEAVYRIFDRSDPLLSAVDDLLLAVEQVAEALARGYALPKSVSDRIVQYQMIGTGRIRLSLQRQGMDPTRRAQRGALISLAARLVNLAANLERIPLKPEDDDAIRLRDLSARLGAIRAELRQSGTISAHPGGIERLPSSGIPMLLEMEQTVALIGEVFQRGETASAPQIEPGRGWLLSLFQPDTFQNPEYRRFALAGCLASTACYFLYNALDWPGIGQTSVLTCIVTALTTIGNSLQAQSLRFAGFVFGGLVMGLSAQILILPGIDSVFGFALLFAAGTAIAAWFATSSPRLSFFGVQVALAFYFVNLQDSHIETDLTIARDKVAGVFLGILAMGFVFDRFGTRSDAEQLAKVLVQNVRMLAQLVACLAVRKDSNTASQISRLRLQINENFASMESQTDAVRFESEFRHRRESDIAECGKIQRIQPWLRSIYLLELSLLCHLGRPEFERESNDQKHQALDRFLKEYSEKLMLTAAWIAHEHAAPASVTVDSILLLQRTFENDPSASSQAIAAICQKMATSFLMLTESC
jgi:multidrug resistance protein MdtO